MGKDEDDLYADLYNEDLGVDGDKDDGGAVDDSLYEEDVKPKGLLNKSAPSQQQSSSSSAGRSSFIPAANPAPSSGSSFIPPDTSSRPPAAAAAPAVSAPSRGSFIPTAAPSSTAQASPYPGANTSRIETVSMTNHDSYNSRVSTAAGGDSAFKQLQPHEMPDEGKLFVGGLNWDTTDEGLKHYFSQFGKVNYCLIMRDPSTQRSRGFAFLTFDDPKAVNSVMVKEHYLDGKIIDPKRAIPRQENVKTAKCFVGGIPSSATPESFKAFFQQYGTLLDSTLMMDRETQRPRGYGFVTYDNDSTVEKLLSMPPLIMDGKMVEVKRATSRNADGTRGAPRTNRTDANNTALGGQQDTSSYMQGGGVANPMAAAAAAMMMGNPMFAGAGAGQVNNQQGAFDPQMMAQFFQQQNWGNANFNPMAFQQMMMGGGMGMGMGMGMGGMGMGMGGWGGGGGGATSGAGGGMSPWMGGGSMSPSAGMGSNSPNQINASARQGGSSSSSNTGGMRNSYAQDRSGSAGAARGRNPNLQAPSSAGLPSRPSTQRDSRSPNAASRDYSREKSPERGSSNRGGTRDSRW